MLDSYSKRTNEEEEEIVVTLKMSDLLADSKAKPPRKWMHHTRTITAAVAASRCAMYMKAFDFDLTSPPIFHYLAPLSLSFSLLQKREYMYKEANEAIASSVVAA